MISIYKILRLILFPFVNFLLPLFSTKLKERISFEKKNQNKRPQGEILFEVSSVGELEQIYSYLEFLLKSKVKVCLYFFSPSVERQCLDLEAQYPNELIVLRYPLLQYLPWGKSWRNPSTLKVTRCLVRYDFFPELLEKKTERLYLFAATSRGLKSSKKLKKIYYTYIIKQFDGVICNLKTEATYFENELKIPALAADFRIPRIRNRLNLSEDTLKKKWEKGRFFLDWLNAQEGVQKLIGGSFWPSDRTSLNGLKQEIEDRKLLFCIVPHELDLNWNEFFKKIDFPFYEINPDSGVDEIKKILSFYQERPGGFFLKIKGVLCELYPLFEFAYVGGGFGHSVHSLLEPFLAGCKVSCGPQIDRSTEYELIHERAPERLQVLLSQESTLDLDAKIKKTKPQDYSVVSFEELNHFLRFQQ